MLEIDIDRIDEILAVEETAYRHFDARHAPLQLKYLDLVRQRLLVRLEHADDVLPVVFFADKQAPLHVLRFAARLDHIAAWILHHVLDRIVEGHEFAVRNNIHPGFLQFFLAERAVVLQPVGIGRPANHFLSLFAERLGFFALAERVIENDDVRPVDVFLPILRLGHESVGDVAFLLVPDEVADFVSLFGNLPGNVADEPRERNEQKILLLHHTLRWVSNSKVGLILAAPPR